MTNTVRTELWVEFTCEFTELWEVFQRENFCCAPFLYLSKSKEQCGKKFHCFCEICRIFIHLWVWAAFRLGCFFPRPHRIRSSRHRHTPTENEFSQRWMDEKPFAFWNTMNESEQNSRQYYRSREYNQKCNNIYESSICHLHLFVHVKIHTWRRSFIEIHFHSQSAFFSCLFELNSQSNKPRIYGKNLILGRNTTLAIEMNRHSV